MLPFFLALMPDLVPTRRERPEELALLVNIQGSKTRVLVLGRPGTFYGGKSHVGMILLILPGKSYGPCGPNT